MFIEYYTCLADIPDKSLPPKGNIFIYKSKINLINVDGGETWCVGINHTDELINFTLLGMFPEIDDARIFTRYKEIRMEREKYESL